MARINGKMTIQEIIITLSEGNPGAISCIMQMITTDPEAIFTLLFFDSMEIYGSKIYMLWNDCSGRDMAKFKETVKYLQSGKISKEEIHKNLDLPYAKPFI